MRADRPGQLVIVATAVALAMAACDSVGKAPVVRPPPIAPETAPVSGQAPASSDGGGGTSIGPLPPGDGGAGSAAEAGAGVPTGNEQVVVYAHSGSDLFSVAPQTLEIRRIGPFKRLTATGTTQYLNMVTDIAVDARGRIMGMTFRQLLEIDAATADCKVIAALPDASFNGLSWIRNETGAETLVATGQDGRVFRIDPATGAADVMGRLGAGLQSSGDLVSVATHGTLVTLRGPTSDLLARLDPATGAATVIGPTGFQKVWGLGFWGNRVFGFTVTGEFILVDPRTGAGSLVRREGAFPFWGAGVTTSVPVID